MGLRQDIGSGPIGLDTAIFIYLIEEHAQFLPLVEPVFAAIDTGALKGTTSGITLLEVLVAPYRAGDLSLAARYEALLIAAAISISSSWTGAHSPCCGAPPRHL